jgi:LysR family transcriptional regulator, glycine cleavage system transcriptional activator
MTKSAPLNALRFFEAAARLGSFVDAAQELHLTHGAISRQIRLLEEALGVALFERRNRGVFLTQKGVQLLVATQQAFAHLNATMAALREPEYTQPLVVSCEPTIAMKWLIPRLGDFYQRYPEVQCHLFAAGGPIAFQQQGVDLALRRNDFNWGTEIFSEVVGEEWIGPVCAPTLLKRHRLDLTQHTLLHTSSRKSAWSNWCKASKTAAWQHANLHYEHFYLSLQAACAGLGVAIASLFMVQEELAQGRLAAPFDFVPDGSHYVLLSPVAMQSDPRRAAFLQWIREQMQADQQTWQTTAK